MNKLLYGAAYYDEYMPYERLTQDVEMMKAANMNVVRIAESTWATMEPKEGEFNFFHIDRVLNAMEQADINVIVGTPTYAFPSWLAKLHPDILAETEKGSELYGKRQNMDITNPDFLFYAERAIRKLMEHVANRSCVIGYQIDNETKHYGTASKHVQSLFINELRQKYPDLNRLNEEFGLNYWSNRINSWDEFPNVLGTINASLGAEFARFQRKLVSRYLSWQAGIIREYKTPNQFITHNFDFAWKGYSFGIQPDVDHFDAAHNLTIAGCDIYHPSQDDLTGAEISFCGDLTRSLKQDNYLVMETQAQGFPEWLPYKGQLRLQAFSHIASGANMVEYWHWHSIHNACETYWKGLLSHDLQPNRLYDEAKIIGSQFNRLSERLVNLKKENRVAILINNESLTGLEWFQIGNGVNYNTIVRWMYDELYRLNVGCDFINTGDCELSKYKMIVVPSLYSASDAMLERLNEYVKNGGHLFVSFKSGFSNENLKVSCNKQPNILSKCCGITYNQFTIPKGVSLKGLDLDDEALIVYNWMELIEPTTAEVIAKYSHPQWSEYAAITRNSYGKGTALYLGCMTSCSVLHHILYEEIKRAGIYDIEQNYEYPIIVKKCKRSDGKSIIFLFNYSDETRTIAFDFSNSIDILSDKLLKNGELISIKPWDLLIAEA